MIRMGTREKEVLNYNMEELLAEAIREDWSLETIKVWSIFKIAQFLEKTAYAPEKKEGED